MIKAKVIEWTIPHHGNVHFCPYGKLLVSDGVVNKICKTKGDKYNDTTGYQYITFRRKRYKVVNVGRLYNPVVELKQITL